MTLSRLGSLIVATEAAHSAKRTFKKTGGQEFTGDIVTLGVQARDVRVAPETQAAGENAPSHRMIGLMRCTA
jgi:uncharacterized protein (DUF736 family)